MPAKSSNEKRFKLALDETRLLIMSSQILLGFQFNGVFQSGFERLPALSRDIEGAGLFLMSVTLALLITPSARHRIADEGQVTPAAFRATRIFSAAALASLSISLAGDLFIVVDRVFGRVPGVAAGTVFLLLSLGLWYALGVFIRERKGEPEMRGEGRSTPLETRIEQMLTEARVALPGAQALLGFQLLAMLTETFDRLPQSSKLVHALALIAVAITVILLVTPAALHRIAFQGEDSERFYRIGSGFVIGALLPLSIGISADLYVAFAKLWPRPDAAIGGATIIFVLLLGLWYAQPMLMRAKTRKRA